MHCSPSSVATRQRGHGCVHLYPYVGRLLAPATGRTFYLLKQMGAGLRAQAGSMRDCMLRMQELIQSSRLGRERVRLRPPCTEWSPRECAAGTVDHPGVGAGSVPLAMCAASPPRAFPSHASYRQRGHCEHTGMLHQWGSRSSEAGPAAPLSDAPTPVSLCRL